MIESLTFDFAHGEPWDDNEDRHSKDKPKVLLSDHMSAAWIPLLRIRVVIVTFSAKRREKHRKVQRIIINR